MTDPTQRPDSEAVFTRSEEELWITTHRRETQRARLVKHVETETETRTVKVRHEQVRVEYEPIIEGDATAPPSAQATSSGERWLVLYDEEVVIQTRWVPRERVRLAVRSVIQDREVSEDLRRERFVMDDTSRQDQPG